jgi:DNA-binding CsgD family transcriptional regulator
VVASDAPRLIERDAELDMLAAAVERLGRGEGGAVLVEAGAGLGKTALLDQVAKLAADARCTVRRAAPGPLERELDLGVVRGLFTGAQHGADAGATSIAERVLWLCGVLAFERPLVLLVDDAQWADRASLEVLNYVARRTEDVPVLIVVAARGGDPDSASDLLSLLGSGPSSTLLEPAPMSPAGAVELVRRLAPDTPYERCREHHGAAAGNPWLLGELAQQQQLRTPSLSPVGRAVVRERLAALTPRDRAVAAALAVLRDLASPHALAAVADIALAQLYPARDALLAAGLLAPDGERFAHGLIAAAVADGLSRSERARLHRESARALLAAGGSTHVIAEHLLEAAPGGDAEVSAALLNAAQEAARDGAPETAVVYLERALDERAAGDDRGRMLSLLGSLNFDAGLPEARARLRDALREARDRDSRVEVLTRLATLQAVEGGDMELAELLRDELAAEHDPQVHAAVEVAALDALMVVPARGEERARRAAAIDLDAIEDLSLRRAVLAHRAWAGAEHGTPDAAACAAMALEALEGDDLLRDASKRAGYHLAVRTLIFADRPAAAQEAIDRICREAKARGSLPLRAATCWHAAELARRTGRVADAEREARMVLELVDDEVSVLSGGAADILVWALAERGAFTEARDFLRERGLDGRLGSRVWEPGIMHARSRLALAEGDFESAHAEACEIGALRKEQGRPNPTWNPWGSTAALALAHLGRRDAAVTMADVELERALEFGAPVPIVAALHARAVAERDDARRIALCLRALEYARGGAAPLESVLVRLELGSTLARMGRRIEARSALRPALADADTAGARPLAERARRELVATGLRPRKAAISGPASLTPRQRQICELAAHGKTNREIGQALFLSVKTVETHLAAGFRKLGVKSRDEMRTELAP